MDINNQNKIRNAGEITQGSQNLQNANPDDLLKENIVKVGIGESNRNLEGSGSQNSYNYKDEIEKVLNYTFDPNVKIPEMFIPEISFDPDGAKLMTVSGIATGARQLLEGVDSPELRNSFYNSLEKFTGNENGDKEAVNEVLKNREDFDGDGQFTVRDIVAAWGKDAAGNPGDGDDVIIFKNT